MKLNRLTHLYVEELKDLYSAENQLVKALPKMARASTSGDLRAGFEGHLEQTKEHVARLEKIFKALGESPNGKKCKHGGPHQRRRRTDRGRSRARGIGCRAYLRRSAGGALRNRRLRLCQHLRKDSRADQAVLLLRQTLEEEKETDKKLTQLAGQINIEAASSEESDPGSKSGKAAKTKAARA